jgi:hypothetical protein
MVSTLDRELVSSSDFPTTLKLSFAEPAARITKDSSLTDCYQTYMMPRLEDRERKPKTFMEYEQAIAVWERLMASKTGLRKAVGQIDAEAAKLFRKRLLNDERSRNDRTLPGRSKATVNKIMRHWKAVVRHLWPADRTNPKG